MTDEDYLVLDNFIKVVLQRVEAGECDLTSAHADIMHPLTALDKGTAAEFAPWMKTRLAKWTR